tara:strand:- start:5 stop:526 length:522 start_codon:yes stop_codon:yes gene_type:complete
MEQSDYSSQEQPIQQNPNPQMQQRTAPLGVKILSIISWIGAILMVLFGAIFLSLGFFIKDMFQQILEELPPEAAADAGILTFVAGFIWIFGGILLILGIFYILIARGLWKGKNWTRIFIIISLSIFIIFTIWKTIQGNYVLPIYMVVIDLIIAGAIMAYLIFSKKVKAFFKGV